MKRAVLLAAFAAAAALACTGAQAHADVGIFFGAPAPVVVAPPPVIYQAPPVEYAPPPVVYGYPDGGEYWEHREWHDEGRHRGWHHHHHDHDDD